MTPIAIDAMPLISITDLGTRPERDITQIVAGFLKLGGNVVAHWVEYARDALHFVMAPGDARSGESY